MSRKDTIIIAVLINAGLLIVLFACALKSNLPSPEIAVSPKTKVVEPALKKEYPITGGDEVDQALHQIAAAPQAQMPAFTTSAPALPSSSFADDLKTFAASQEPIAMSAVFSPPAAQTLADEKKNSDFTEIKVKKGDVLEKIARNHHTTVDAILSFNQLSSTSLRIGQTLKIPSKKTVQTVSSSIPAPLTSTASDGRKYYIVKNGDNPWTIAVKNHMKVDELLKLNNLDQEKARKLKPGDKLLIQ